MILKKVTGPLCYHLCFTWLHNMKPLNDYIQIEVGVSDRVVDDFDFKDTQRTEFFFLP